MPLPRWRVMVALSVMLALVGCSAPGSLVDTTGSGTTVASAACTASACQPGGGTQAASIFVEPDARAAPVVHAIDQAKASVWVEAYLLTDSQVIHALESAANKGVDVRVLLELSPYGGGSVSPQVTLERLQAAGVKAQGADPTFQYTHAKTMVVDHTTAFIMTCNLTLSGLGGSSSATNRDFGVIDTDAADVSEAEAIFQADWTRSTLHQSDPNVIVSPVDARAKLTALIDSARSQLLLEDEELVDPQIEGRLIAAAQRGTIVEIVLPAPGRSSSSSADLSHPVAAGVHVRYDSQLYMHAKIMVIDGHLSFVGSENFSATSLDANREVGVIVSTHDALTTLMSTFDMDWSASSPA